MSDQEETEIRCDQRVLFGKLLSGGAVLETRCRSRWCGYRSGIVVLHRFSIPDGALVETLKFKDPNHSQKGRG